MPNLTSIGLNAGIPTSGTGTVSTIDQLIAVGVPVSAGLPTGANTIGSVINSAGNNNIGGFMLQDGSGGTNNRVLVASFHNTDNQALGNVYGLNTGGVAQLLNPIGNIDRQRGTGVDNTPATGISTGVATSAMFFKTFSNNATAIAVGANTVTPVAVSGKIGNVPWSIQTGSALIIGAGSANQETVIVTAANSTTFTAPFTLIHPANTLITGFTYNQGRDAAGENDGASGAGTSVAAGYEYNGGDPSGGQYDRERSLNAKAFSQVAISSGATVGSNSIVVAASGTLQPGMKVLLSNNAIIGSQAFESVNVDLSYIPGSTTVPLSSNVVQTIAGGYTFISYDSFGALGPQLNGFLPFGVGIEEEALYDPVSGKYYIERAATQDGVVPQNVVLESPALWNGTSMDRLPGTAAAGAKVQPNLAVAAATMATTQVAMTSTAASILAARTGAVGTGRVKYDLYNIGTSTVYIGNSAGVTTATGFPLLAGGSMTDYYTGAVYGICAATLTATIATKEVY